jgi:hypothetical protein
VEQTKKMRNRLPLPIATIKEIHSVIDQNSRDLYISNPLRNALRNICEYNYAKAVDILKYMKTDYPSLMDYTKHINAIRSAEKRYNAI